MTDLAIMDERPQVDSVGRVIEFIADQGYVPGPPGLPWVGRQDTVQQAIEKFGISPEEAEALVDQAHQDIWQRGAGTHAHVERRLLATRLVLLRRYITAKLAQPRKTTTFVFRRKRNADGSISLIRVPRRESIREGLDPNAVRLLLDIEAMIAKLNDLDNGGAELVTEIFKQLERDHDGTTTEKTTTSISQRVKTMDLSKLSAASRAIVEKATAQERRKATKAREVPLPVAKTETTAREHG